MNQHPLRQLQCQQAVQRLGTNSFSPQREMMMMMIVLVVDVVGNHESTGSKVSSLHDHVLLVVSTSHEQTATHSPSAHHPPQFGLIVSSWGHRVKSE